MLAWSLVAVWAAHPGKTFLEIPTLEKSSHRMLDNGSPEAVLGLISIVVNLLKSVKVLGNQTPQIGGLRIAWLVQCGQFGACSHHEAIHQVRNRTRIQLVHPMPSMVDRLATSCRKYTGLHRYGRTPAEKRTVSRPLNDVNHWEHNGCEERFFFQHCFPVWKTCS